jgi:hypothetical protein
MTPNLNIAFFLWQKKSFQACFTHKKTANLFAKNRPTYQYRAKITTTQHYNFSMKAPKAL